MSEKEFITNWAAKLWSDSLKKFPADFISSSNGRTIELPGKALVIGEQFFGAFEILTIDGNAVYQASDHDEAKFIIYANREKVRSVSLPGSAAEIKEANNKYENYLDGLIRIIEKDYKIYFPGMKNSNGVVNEIFRALNLIRY